MERFNNYEQLNIVSDQDKILRESGLWSNPSLKEKYKYRLSPDCMVLTGSERAELEEIANAIYGKGGFLDGSLQLLQKMSSERFVGTILGGSVKKSLTNGINRDDIAMQQINPQQKPFITRLDLVKVQRESDSQPSFQIVEVEGDKTHGFGYLSLMDLFREKYFERKDTLGIIDGLKLEIEQRGLDKSNPVLLIVGRSERFYLSELEVFARLANEKGLNITTTLEDNIKIEENKLTISGNTTPFDVLINIPTLTPNGYTGSGINQQSIMDLFKNGVIKVLIPPKRTLGSKGLLGIVRNGDNDPEIEELLKETFDTKKLADLRKFIPETFVISKRNKNLSKELLANNPDKWVIKQTVSSGMKGVALPSDSQKSSDFLDKALNSPFNFVMQKKINQETRVFNYVEPEALSNIKRASMFMRVELFAGSSGIITVGVTGRESPSVHGAKDCIQIPIIFE